MLPNLRTISFWLRRISTTPAKAGRTTMQTVLPFGRLSLVLLEMVFLQHPALAQSICDWTDRLAASPCRESPAVSSADDLPDGLLLASTPTLDPTRSATTQSALIFPPHWRSLEKDYGFSALARIK